MLVPSNKIPLLDAVLTFSISAIIMNIERRILCKNIDVFVFLFFVLWLWGDRISDHRSPVFSIAHKSYSIQIREHETSFRHHKHLSTYRKFQLRYVEFW
jgi:hypothetical protein